jgi:hypothetical protein
LAKRAWHSLRRSGPGRIRTKLADMLKQQLGITIDPHDMHQNQAPPHRWLDLCRWCADGTNKDGRFVHICSWDRMGDIVKSGTIAVVDDDYLSFEICRGSVKKNPDETQQ